MLSGIAALLLGLVLILVMVMVALATATWPASTQAFRLKSLLMGGVCLYGLASILKGLLQFVGLLA